MGMLTAAGIDAPRPFVCPICLRASYHPRAAAERFCAVCGFVDDVPATQPTEGNHT